MLPPIVDVLSLVSIAPSAPSAPIVSLALIIPPILALAAITAGLLLALRVRFIRRVAAQIAASSGAFGGFLAALAGYSEHGLRRLLAATLRWPPVSASSSSSADQRPDGNADADARATATPSPPAWGGIVILSRLIGLALAVCILLGEYTVNVLRVPIVQYGIATAPPSGLLGVDVTAGVLFMAMSVLWGVMVLDLLDVVPRNVQLFPFLAPRLRQIFVAIAVAGFTLTVLAAALLYYAGQRIVDGDPLPAVADVLSPLQGVLLNVVAVPALWAALLGLVGLLSLLCAVLIVVCALARLLFDFVARLLLAYAVGSGGGGLGPGVDAQYLDSVRDLDTDLEAGGRELRPYHYHHYHHYPFDPSDDHHDDPFEEDRDMADSLRMTTIIGCARTGARLAPAIVHDAAYLGSARTVLGFARLDPDRLVEAPVVRPRHAGPIRDLSPTRDEIRAALEAHGQEGVYEALIEGLTEGLVALHEPGRLGEGQILWVDEVRNLPQTVLALRQLKARLVRRTIIVVAFLPEPGLEDEQVDAGREQLRALHADGVITVVLYVDPRSPLALSLGEDLQQRAVVRWLASQLDAHLQDPRNPRLAEAALALGQQGYASSLGLRTAPITSGHSPRLYGLLRPLFHGPHRGPGDVEDAFNQSRVLTQQLLDDETTRTFAAVPDLAAAPHVEMLGVEPFDPRDDRMPVLCERFRTWLIGWQPSARATLLCGDGAIPVALGQPADYGVLVGCWFSITESTDSSARSGSSTSSSMAPAPVASTTAIPSTPTPASAPTGRRRRTGHGHMQQQPS